MSFRILYDRNTAFVFGPKAEARRRIAACGDYNPTWVRRRDAWATSPAVASRVLDQFEGRARVPIDDTDQTELDLTETQPANKPERQAGLW